MITDPVYDLEKKLGSASLKASLVFLHCADQGTKLATSTASFLAGANTSSAFGRTIATLKQRLQ